MAIDLASPKNPTPHWRTPVEGSRADHAAISEDGTRLLVSASTAKKVHEIYFQMSFLHGFYEFNVPQKRVTRMKVLPGAEALEKLAPGDFQLNSADHGITLSGDNRKLCVAGTMTGDAYIVDRDTFNAVTQIDLHHPERPSVSPKPYWATTSADGENCYLSLSELNQVVVISFDEEKIIGRVDVGPEKKAGADEVEVVHPQRVRNGRVLVSALDAATP